MDPIALLRLDRELALWRKAGRAPAMWWRDDDARTPTPELDRLLNVASGAPLSLAIIPDGDLPALAKRLDGVPGVTIAQHGVDHENRRAYGEARSEFTFGTPGATIARAVLTARRRMEDAGLAPVFFTPPWNESDAPLLQAIKTAGYPAYSVGIYGRPEEGLLHFGAQVDFLRWKGAPRFRSSGRILNALRRQLEWRRTTDRFAKPVGILTHHLVHDEATWRGLEWFLPFARMRFRWLGFPEMLEARVNTMLKLIGEQPNSIPAREIISLPMPTQVIAAGSRRPGLRRFRRGKPS